MICDVCGADAELDAEGRFAQHRHADEAGRWCENSKLFPLESDGGGVWEISGGQWESNRRKH